MTRSCCVTTARARGGWRCARERSLRRSRDFAAVPRDAVVETVAGNALAQGADASVLAHQQADFKTILDEGHHRLAAMGLVPEIRMEVGEPVGKITSVAAETGADLVVVGHHQQGLWTRWMSRSVAAGLSDALGCSLLLAQKVVKESELSTKAEQV